MNRLWHGGRLIKGRLSIASDDRGLTLGDGLFETIAVTNGVALWRFQHLERLRAGAQELGLPFPRHALAQAIHALTSKVRGSHVLRLMLTRGAAARGLAGPGKTPTLIGTLRPFDAGLRFEPLTLATSHIRRNLSSPSSRLKTTSYIDNILAAREAQAKAADEALMLNTAGRIASVSIGNVFLEKGGVLMTPALSEGILPGVMRGAVISVAKSLGITVREKQLWPRDMDDADAVLVTNSLRFVRPVTRCDDRRFAAGSKILAQITQALLDLEQQQLAHGERIGRSIERPML